MSKLKQFHLIERTGNIMSCEMRMMYAAPFTAVRPSKNEQNPKKFHWTITGLISPDMDISFLQDQIQQVAEANMTPAQLAGGMEWRNPLKQTKDASPSLRTFAGDFPYLIQPNAKAFKKDGTPQRAPQVIYANGETVSPENEADDFYNGRKFRCSVQAYWYPANDGLPGVGLGLANIQLLGHAKPLAGAKAQATDEFEAVDDGALDDAMADML